MESNTLSLVESYFPEKSPNTIKAYTRDLETFCGYFAVKTAGESLELLLSLPENQANLVVLHYKSELLQQGQTPSTINRKLSTLRSLVKKAYKKGMVPWTLNITNEKPVAPIHSRQLTKKEIQNLLAASLLQPNPKKAARDHAILCLMFDLALKRNSISSLQYSDVRLSSQSLLLPALPQEKLRVKKLPQRTTSSLKHWITFRGDLPGPLFMNIDYARKKEDGLTCTSIYRIVRCLGESINLVVTPEDIRKTAIAEAVKLAEKYDIPAEDLLAFTDHKNTVSLRNYHQKRREIQGSLSSFISAE